MSRQARFTQEKQCQACGRSFWAARSDARTCGPACKKALQRGTEYRREKMPWGSVRLVKRPSSCRNVPFIAAPGTDPPAQLRQDWPQDLEVIVEPPKGKKKPGRIDWRILLTQASKVNAGMVPVNLGFSWEWVHPAQLLNMARRPK